MEVVEELRPQLQPRHKLFGESQLPNERIAVLAPSVKQPSQNQQNRSHHTFEAPELLEIDQNQHHEFKTTDT